MQVIWFLKLCNMTKSGGGTIPPLQILGDLSRPRLSVIYAHAPDETLSVPAVLPRWCTVTVAQLCYCDTLSGSVGGNSYRYLVHYKNF